MDLERVTGEHQFAATLVGRNHLQELVVSSLRPGPVATGFSVAVPEMGAADH
ncbi:MAG: hypothetical protein ACYDC1_03065 [Limisphaerales bacterium]